jgi:C4-dicarboxylate-specific signal transduction histidine kinase
MGFVIYFGKLVSREYPSMLNHLVRDASQSLIAELTDNSVLIRTQLESGLPFVDGHKGQLQEVIINIVHNAIEAMRATPDRKREVLIRTKLNNDATIAVHVEDTGPGSIQSS